MKNPYVENFLNQHPMASTAQAQFGESAWDAAIATVIKTVAGTNPKLAPALIAEISKLKSTEQRYK